MEMVLASASPRRRELLALAGFSFSVCPSGVDETLEEGVSGEQAVQLLAQRKAEEVFARHPEQLIVASDTVVCLDRDILGKPKDVADAAGMLLRLSGQSHRVYTGVCIRAQKGRAVFCEQTEVVFYPLSEREIAGYITTLWVFQYQNSAAFTGIFCRDSLCFLRKIHKFFVENGVLTLYNKYWLCMDWKRRPQRPKAAYKRRTHGGDRLRRLLYDDYHALRYRFLAAERGKC